MTGTEKVLDLPPDEQPGGLPFLVTCDLSARTRQEVRRRCGDELTCQFWTGTEFDRRIKRHAVIVAEFFDAGTSPGREQQPNRGGGPGIQASGGGVVQLGSGDVAFTSPI